jgi:hypothetical protein
VPHRMSSGKTRSFTARAQPVRGPAGVLAGRDAVPFRPRRALERALRQLRPAGITFHFG